MKIRFISVALQWRYYILFLGLFASCRKETDKLVSTGFTAAAAKEWYYGKFMKSAEWLKYNSDKDGMKSPDWDQAVVKKIGTTEWIEFPLRVARKKLGIVSNATGDDEEARTLAAASQTRVVFIRRRDGQVLVREVDYVPDGDYAKRKASDLSAVSIFQSSPDFTGRIRIRHWGGSLINVYKVDGGTQFRRLEWKPSVSRAPNGRSACGGEATVVIEFERECHTLNFGDVILFKSCDDWTPTGNYWVESDCVENRNKCEAMSSEDCACPVFDFCDDNATPEDACPKPDDIRDAMEVISEDESEPPGFASVNIFGTVEREARKNWSFYKGTLFGWTFRYQSHETGRQQFEGGHWRWKTFEHTSVDRIGSFPLKTECHVSRASTWIAPDRMTAGIDLEFVVSVTIECGIAKQTVDEAGVAWKDWKSE